MRKVWSAITVGAFDGVHLGHQGIISRLRSKAEELAIQSTIVTIWPHPSHVIGTKPLRLINTLEEKKFLLSKTGVDNIIVLPFTHDFSRIESAAFIREFLINQFGMKYFLVGYNHHFGSDRLGDINIIRQFGQQLGFEVEKAGPVEVNGEKISSTKIRQAILEGNIYTANTFLGYNFCLSGIVNRGQMLGRTIGFPTANIQIDYDYKLIPRDGVYAVKVELNNTLYNGMLNIGHRPTVNTDKLLKTIEAHILDFDSDIYGHTIKVHFVERIRDEIRFDSLDNLKKQLAQDKLHAKKLLI